MLSWQVDSIRSDEAFPEDDWYNRHSVVTVVSEETE